ncbi:MULTISPECIES: chromate efflux transporter [Microbacterium]|uniref:chromate efflux transporter n=1 Tax=Microbacterium TaxID=33882 RepID=UPI002784CB7F|nr:MULTISPECIES: chromate efflux transporter [Microbacterium]MDQ1082794.1 chromate transporter [Microbacterium sp. SORGH_AS_0344]MDQ1168436.1 chromate transporter [Microbacterium proteolyticum]
MQKAGRVGEVFLAFLRLGLTSFGGPVAHLGYFRDDLVERRKWMDDRAYADLVALCQFLPGPASSQVGFAMGLQRAGILGALAAFAAFTFPSAILLVAFAAGAASLGGPVGAGILAGLKIVAVAIVAHAVWGMARTLTPDATRAGIAVIALGLALLLPAAPGQLGALAFGVVAGLVLLRGVEESAGATLASFGVRRGVAIACLVLFTGGLIALPLLAAATGSSTAALVDAFFRAGALVFGGGHVALPLLQAGVVDTGWVSPESFLAGYGAAQAVPGPLFTFSAYLGAVSTAGPGGILGAALALGAMFLPGFLILVGVLPFWDAVRTRPRVRAAMRGANAAVVGILGAALYAPVFSTAITGPGPLVLAVVGFVLLTAFRTPAWAVVLVGAAGGVVLALA